MLPPEYNEILDYNAIQYQNGFFRTQIGRYVKVEQLVGSNSIEEYYGFLIGVGINYIVLQDYDSDNIRVLDIYGNQEHVCVLFGYIHSRGRELSVGAGIAYDVLNQEKISPGPPHQKSSRGDFYFDL